ncbi:hypothetical protein LDENG_00098920 [Lucifuga dentata]|nr:hypothetical protein LDENG_00098920 [Lucifuga dentata]
MVVLEGQSQPTHVTTATPAKRITFYKSGDSQFGGIRMAVHKRSFKCFDALLDDLSQKMPLPFGVRTVTTPHGTHSVKHLEQLQDGSCYLCSDRRQAKPINMELATKRPAIWYHHSRRPQRPEDMPAAPHSHLSYRQRRILLVKNSEPGLRRSVVLNRRLTRSLRTFLDEASKVMQFHVRKLYTVEGRKIDSIQSLMTCPTVLVCVGREAFSPVLANFIRKSSEDKLPGLGTRSPGLGPRTPRNGAQSPATQGPRSPPHGAQSRDSEYSEGHESKKNVNFGLETKKSIIHPRSDSSNRSTRFSLCSEKSCGNGLSTFSQARPAITNDDIEKRILVNKDGSLSVEMRVHFRLQNDESLQWSTQIKKSPSLTNDCCLLSQTQSHYLLQGQSESCSDPDSTNFEPDGVDYNHMEGNHCPCCYHRQEEQYDLWENTAHSHKHPPVPPPHAPSHTHTTMRHSHSSSSSSSCHSRRVVRCRARLSNCGGASGSKPSQLVQEEMCVTEEVQHRVEVEQGGDTHVEVSMFSRCCSCSGVTAVDSNLRPHSRTSGEDDRSEGGCVELNEELMVEEEVEEERPISVISNSSHVLQALKEDQDDEEDDLPPSASQCNNELSLSPTLQTQQDSKPASNVSMRGSMAQSAASSCRCGGDSPRSAAGVDEMDGATTSKSKISQGSQRSTKEEESAGEEEEAKRVVSGLSGHTKLSASSGQSGASSVCPHCGGCNRGTVSRASQRSNHSQNAPPKPSLPLSNQENGGGGEDEQKGSGTSDGSNHSAVSIQSNKSNLTNNGHFSAMSNILEGTAFGAISQTSNQSKYSSPSTPAEEHLRETAEKEEERAPSVTSATSHKSSRSHMSGCNDTTHFTDGIKKERNPSIMSTQSNLSVKSGESPKSNDIRKSEDADGENTEKRPVSAISARSGTSAKTSASVKSHKSHKSHKSSCHSDKETASPIVQRDNMNKRAPSALSVKSNISAISDKSPESTVSLNTTECDAGGQEMNKIDGQREKDRPDSVLSGKSSKSNVSVRSNKSHISLCINANDESTTDAKGKVEKTEIEDRATSAMSAKSNLSAKSNKSRKPINALERSEDGEERTASKMSARSVKSNMSSKSCRSNFNGNAAAASPSPSSKAAEEMEEIDKETVQEEAQQRSESVKSAKSENEERPVSGTAHNSNCDTRTVSPAKATPTVEVDRTPSTMSEKSSKSQKSNCTVGSSGPNEAETTEKEKQARVSSAMSLKSGSSVKSSISHKSKSAKSSKTVSPSPDIAIINTDADKEDNTPSIKSPKTATTIKERSSGDTGEGRSNSSLSQSGQNLSPSRTQSPRSNLPKSPSSPKTLVPSPVQQHLPGPDAGGTRGPSALSVNSTTSAKSNRSKCRCGASSKAKKEVEDKEVVKKEENKAVNCEEDKEISEWAPSVLSSLSKMSKRESEEMLSHNSSGSISLGLPEEQEQETANSDSGKSQISSNTNMKTEGSIKTATPDVPRSEGSVKPTTSHSPQTVDIPAIETPGGAEEGEEVEGQTEERAFSAKSCYSNKSRKSTCNCSKAKANDKAKSDGDSANNETENQVMSRPAGKAKGKEENIDENVISINAKSPSCLRPESAASAQSGSKMKVSTQSKGEEKQDTLSPAKAHKVKSNAGSDAGSVRSVRTSNSQKKEIPTKPLSPCSSHTSKPSVKVATPTESTLSHSLSAADLLKEKMSDVQPCSQQSKGSAASGKTKSEKSGRSHKNKDQEEELPLMPACLPSTSPHEVVSDWLRSIPANSCMLTLENELNEGEEEPEKEVEDKPGEELIKEEEENSGNGKAEEEEPEEKAEIEEEEKKEEKAESEEKRSDAAPRDVASTSSRPADLFLNSEALPRNCHSSTAVMKVLLRSSLERCHSLPEVSPAYGHRLSKSAKLLLDCLAELHLIELAGSSGCDQKDGNQHYDEIMSILQSLWLAGPRNMEGAEVKNGGKDQVTPPRSSSGVEMSSGSGGSGKDNGNRGEDKTPTKQAASLHEEEEEQVKERPKEGPMQSSAVPSTVDSPKASENPSSSVKSSANDSSKSPTDNNRDTLDDSSSGTPPTDLRAPLTKGLSRDPDPVWVLNLLKKLERQFMSHYITAMAEFKVRWDLDDSIILDAMISELRDEEMKKIQGRAGRAGRSPRPPQGDNLSRESTMTERRRQMLKVMKNQSVKTGDSLSDGEMMGDFSDQRSEDEYCPCDACIRKKMAARPLKMKPQSAEAPVMMEFDLRKILQLKKSPAPPSAPLPAAVSETVKEEGDRVFGDEGGRNLEVVQEEEEEV